MGASKSLNQIGNVGQFVKAYIDHSTVSAPGNVSLSSSGAPEIDASAIGGAGSGAGTSGIALAGAFAGAVTTNTINESILSAIQDGSAVITTAGQGGSIDLSSTDASSITADAGGVAIAIAVGGGGGGALSVGFAQATNTIGNTTTSDIDSSLATADGGVSISASSLASINALSYGGSGSVGAGSDVGVALAGAGAGASNNVNDNIYAYILDCQNSSSYGVTATTGSVALSATDGPSIFSTTHGGSVAIGAGATLGVGVAITAVQSFNTIMDLVKSYIDNSLVTALHAGTGQVTLVATTPPSSQIESNGIAVSIGGSASDVGAGISGGGAGATNMITNRVEAYIDNLASVQADNLVSVTTTDNAQIDSSVGAYAVAFGLVGASIGASIQSSTVNNSVSAYINAPVTVNNGDITVTARSTVSVTGTAVATSIAAGGGAFAGGGDNTTSEIDGSVEAYVGKAGVLTIPSTGSVTIQAISTQNAEADSHGYAVSVGPIVVAIGVSLGTATIDGTTKAYMSGTLPAGQSLSVLATNNGIGNATIFALAGGIGFGGAAQGPAVPSTSTRS